MISKEELTREISNMQSLVNIEHGVFSADEFAGSLAGELLERFDVIPRMRRDQRR